MKHLISAIVIMVAGFAATSASGDLVGEPAATYGWQSAGAGTDVMIGWLFSTNEPVEVTALGVFDHHNPPGLNGEHPVVIWDSEGDIVVSATVPAGTVAPQVGGPTRYVAVTPTTLPAGQTFLIAAQYTGVGNGDWWAHAFNTLNFDPAITFIEGRQLNTSDLVQPTDSWATPRIGPNFLMNVVPEPTSLALLTMAALALCHRRRR